MEVGTRISNQVGDNIRAEFGESNQFVSKVGNKISAEIGYSNDCAREGERRILAEFGESRLCLTEAENRVTVEQGKSRDLLIHEIRNVDTLLTEDRESSVRRFIYVTEAGEGARRWYMDLMEAVAKPLVLRFLCEAAFKSGRPHEITTQDGIDVNMIKDWAKKLLPLVARTLKVGSVLANVAGKIALLGLDLLIGSDSELSRLTDNLAKIAEGGADYTQYASEAVDSYVAGQPSVPSTSGSSTSSWNPDTVMQIRGDRVRALSRVRKRMEEEGTWSPKVGLRRVRLRLETDNQRGEKHVKWICSSCHECYERERPGNIQDYPVDE